MQASAHDLPNRPRGLALAGALTATLLLPAVAQETDRQYCERQQGPARVACLRELDRAPAAAPPARTAPAATSSATATPAASPTPNAAAPRAAAAATPNGAKPYRVVDGDHVDDLTFKGFQTWRAAACDRCHGANQQGLVGPSLIESLKTLSKEDFVKTVTNGRLEKGMPSFSTSTTVTSNLDALYAYLKGRSDGAITQAHVQRIGTAGS